MRSVVSYDDLEQLAITPTPGPPPAKRRKRQQNKRKPVGSQKLTHWDEPKESYDMPLVDHNYSGDPEVEVVDIESRELTHEEIWDDSALIKAWDAAMCEYKAFHGPENKWKTDPISKPSPLWHNVPPSPIIGAGSGSEPPSSARVKREGGTTPALDHDSEPLNFNTFVPSHDPTLSNPAATDAQNLADIPQSEAFRNALNAMYWTGYWTAVYHCRSVPDQHGSQEMDDTESGKDESESSDGGGIVGKFVTSQR